MNNNRNVRYLFCFPIKPSKTVLCCISLIKGSYFLGFLSLILVILYIWYSISLYYTPASIIINSVFNLIRLTLIISLMFSMHKFNYNIVFFTWIFDTILTIFYLFCFFYINVRLFMFKENVFSENHLILMSILFFIMAIILYSNFVIFSVTKHIGDQNSFHNNEISISSSEKGKIRKK